jgi:hypothetical protein
MGKSSIALLVGTSWDVLGLVSETGQDLIPEMKKALWVEYKKLQYRGLNIFSGIQVKCKKLPIWERGD